MSQIEIAYRIASKAHEGQKRRDGTTNYIHHPADVANRLQGESDEVVATAWLHDVLEDTPVTMSELERSGISYLVRDAVWTLTKNRNDYEAYIRVVKWHPIARKVKIADIISNLADKPTEKQIVKYARALLILIDV